MSLVEVAFALAILSLLITALFATLVAANRAETMSREREAVGRVAGLQLESASSTQDFDNVMTTFNNFAFDVPYGLADAAGVQPSLFGVNSLNTGADVRKAGHIAVVFIDADGGTTTPVDYDADGNNDYVEIRVTIVWKSSDGTPTSYGVSTRRAR